MTALLLPLHRLPRSAVVGRKPPLMRMKMTRLRLRLPRRPRLPVQRRRSRPRTRMPQRRSLPRRLVASKSRPSLRTMMMLLKRSRLRSPAARRPRLSLKSRMRKRRRIQLRRSPRGFAARRSRLSTTRIRPPSSPILSSPRKRDVPRRSKLRMQRSKNSNGNPTLRRPALMLTLPTRRSQSRSRPPRRGLDDPRRPLPTALAPLRRLPLPGSAPLSGRGKHACQPYQNRLCIRVIR